MTMTLLLAVALATERHYDFRKELTTVHEAGLRDAAAVRAADEIEVGRDWTILLPGGASDFAFRAAQDFQDYLAVSMGVDVRVARDQGSGNGDQGKTMAIAVDAGMKARSERIEVTAKGVTVAAADERSLAQALYHLEDLMNLRRAPFLRIGVENRERLFSPRMTHSGWACDEFPDGYLRRIAHAGMDAILVFVRDVDRTKGNPGYQDVNDLIRRAKAVGVDTYLYSYIHAFAHPDDPGAERIFADSYGRVSAAYPDAAGLILVGESCEFPTKDPRAIPVAARDRGKEYEGDTRPMAGYFPCNDYHRWLKAVTDAVRRHNQKCDVVFWTYNWGGADDTARLELIDRLQKDVSLMATWEMFERFRLPSGYACKCADYTQTFVGPGHYFTTEAERAKRDGLRLYAQSCTGGITWDFGDVPYMPVPHHWKLRWDGMVKAHDAWGLSGLMEGHHMGWHPNFVSELCKEAFVRGGIPFERHIRAIAARDFGEANAEAVVGAWAKWSEASAYVAPTHANQYAMFRTGPAYPFNALGPRIQFGIGGDGSEDYPHCPYAPNGLRIARLNYADDQVRQWVEGLDYFPRMEIPAKELEAEIDGLRKAAGLFLDGAAVLRRAADTLEGARRAKAHKIAGVGEFMGRTCRTAVNVKTATAAEDVILSDAASADEKAEAGRRILACARDEYANAEAALPLVDADSSLGWEPTMEYCGAREQIEWKLKRMASLYGKDFDRLPEGRAEVTLGKPQLRWLFGGFGFQNAEAQLTPFMTDEFRDERALKCFRELSPSFSRCYVGFADASKEALDRFADYYDLTFRGADTTIYAVGGVMPADADTLDPDAHAEGVAKGLEYLVKTRNCRKIRYYCLTNELMSGDKWGYFWFQRKMPLFKRFHEALYRAFRRHGLDIQLAASDGSYGRSGKELLKWTVDNMDDVTGVYCTHYYDGVEPGAADNYGIFLGQFSGVVQLALPKMKRWMLGEFGVMPPREKGVMADDRNWNGYCPDRAPVAALTTAEMAFAAVNAGAYALMSWSFCDYPEPFPVEDGDTPLARARYESAKSVYRPDVKYNKWGVFRWNDEARDYRAYPTYPVLGLLSRYFRKGATVLAPKTEDRELRVAALANPDGSTTVALVNWGGEKTVVLGGAQDFVRPARVYACPSDAMPLNGFNDLPAPRETLEARDGRLAVRVPGKSFALVTTDYVARVPSEIDDVDEDDGVLTWDACEDPEHCYYRVYEDGRQVASTVATSFKRIRTGARYDVYSVDRWGNCRKESK